MIRLFSCIHFISVHVAPDRACALTSPDGIRVPSGLPEKRYASASDAPSVRGAAGILFACRSFKASVHCYGFIHGDLAFPDLERGNSYLSRESIRNAKHFRGNGTV